MRVEVIVVAAIVVVVLIVVVVVVAVVIVILVVVVVVTGPGYLLQVKSLSSMLPCKTTPRKEPHITPRHAPEPTVVNPEPYAPRMGDSKP